MKIPLLRQLTKTPWVQRAVGFLGAEYLRLTWNTSRRITEPEDIYERIPRDSPVIIAMWHGQHFLMPFIKRAEHRAKALISRHRDGEINTIIAQRLGVDTIRGSGDHGVSFLSKGGIGAFTEMLDALHQGYHVALTADIPTVARVCGFGIVKLASLSGCPIYPIAIATSRRIELDNWDRTAINLPFSRIGGVAGEPVHVPMNADDEALDRARRSVEDSLNAATVRAYTIADKSGNASVMGDQTKNKGAGSFTGGHTL
jgi:lysophospholipid acyltransferase (LPLAT)-like uncharacterized protein